MFPVHLNRPPSIIAPPSKQAPSLPILHAPLNRRLPIIAPPSKQQRARKRCQRQSQPARKPPQAAARAAPSRPAPSPRIISDFAATPSAICNVGWMKIKRQVTRFLPPPATDNAITHTPHEPQPLNTFCAKHCVNCQAGWVRSTKLGATVVICLIDREPVLANITACNKFKPIEI